METLQITKDNALLAYNEGCGDVKKMLANLFGKKTFEKQKITERINTLDDVFAEAGTTRQEFYDKCKRNELTPDEIGYRLAKVVVQVLNEEWVPDWSNPNQRKWCLWFFMNKPGFRLAVANFVCSNTDVGSRLCLKDEATAIFAATKFPDVFKQFFTE